MRNTILVIIGLFAAIVGVVYFFSAAGVATAPARVANEVTQTGNILGNYEQFYDLKSGYDGRVSQIASLKEQLEFGSETERRYARVDLNGAKQACRELANKYNADSQKMNRSAFKAENLPETLDATKCEG